MNNQKLILNLKSQYKVIIKNLLLIRNWPQINRRYTPHFGCVPFDAHSALGIISTSLCVSNVKQEQIMLTIKIFYSELNTETNMATKPFFITEYIGNDAYDMLSAHPNQI